MLRRKLIILFVVIAVSIIFFTTCSKDPTGPDDPLETILSDMTIVIDPTLVPILEFAEDHIEFDMPSWIPGLPEFEIGVILVCPPCEKAPHGFLRRITNIDRGLRTTAVHTEQGTLEETFEETDIEILEDMVTTGVNINNLGDGIEFIPDSRDPTRFNFDFDKIIELQPGLNLHLEGNFEFTQSTGLSVQIKWFRLKKITFTSNTTTDINLNATLEGFGGLPDDFYIGGNLLGRDPNTGEQNHLYEYIQTFMVGPVPVTIYWTIDLIWSLNANGEFSISTSLIQSNSADASIKYRRSNSPRWSASSDHTNNTTFTEPDISANLYAKLGVGPSLEAKLYGVAGPFIALSGYIEYDADTSEVPWWILNAGLSLDGGFEMDVCGYSAGWSKSIFDLPIPLAQAPDNQCLPPKYDPPGNLYFTGQDVEITSETPGSEIRYTTDGSEPNSDSQLYTSPIDIASETNLKAKAFNEPDWVESCVASQFYNFRLFEDNFVFVEGGNFEMGDLLDEGNPDESPVHEVTLNDFWMGKYEVTQGEYQSLTGENPGQGYGVGDNYPVYYVSWYDAAEYCNLRSIAEGLTPTYNLSTYSCNFSADGYRLPTEAEWEYAARGGIYWPDNYRYSGTTDNINEFAWYSQNSGNQTHEVGLKQPNQLDIFDMSGNVWEWCNDWYDEFYYLTSPVNNPTGPASGSYRHLRSGGWYDNAWRTADRHSYNPSGSLNRIGFRLCRNAAESTRGN